MTDLRTAAQQALKAMEKATNVREVHLDHYFEAMNDLRAALAEPVQRVGCEGDDGLLRIHSESETCDVCCTRATCRIGQRVPLTDEQIVDAVRQARFAALVAAAEREACAQVCESIDNYDENVDSYYSDVYAAAIRARGDTNGRG